MVRSYAVLVVNDNRLGHNRDLLGCDVMSCPTTWSHCKKGSLDLGLLLKGGSVTTVMSTSEYLNRFRSGFTLSMVWTVKNDSDADPFNLDRNAVRGVVSIRV